MAEAEDISQIIAEVSERALRRIQAARAGAEEPCTPSPRNAPIKEADCAPSCDTCPSVDSCGTVLGIRLNQSELAAMIGATRESVNKHLRAFRTRGVIEMQGHRIVIRDPSALRRRIA